VGRAERSSEAAGEALDKKAGERANTSVKLEARNASRAAVKRGVRMVFSGLGHGSMERTLGSLETRRERLATKRRGLAPRCIGGR
jgi:hypothetical protein